MKNFLLRLYRAADGEEPEPTFMNVFGMVFLDIAETVLIVLGSAYLLGWLVYRVPEETRYILQYGAGIFLGFEALLLILLMVVKVVVGDVLQTAITFFVKPDDGDTAGQQRNSD